MTERDFTNISGKEFERVDLNQARFRDVDLTRARFERVDLSGAVMRGMELVNVTIDGEIDNLRINGVDVAPLVNAELDRRFPDRVKMRPTDAVGFREAWDLVERLWEGTVTRARGPFDEMSDVQGVPRNRDVRPSLDEVLTLRRDRMATVRQVIDDLTDDKLDSHTEPVAEPGWPRSISYPVRECLLCILNVGMATPPVRRTGP